MKVEFLPHTKGRLVAVFTPENDASDVAAAADLFAEAVSSQTESLGFGMKRVPLPAGEYGKALRVLIELSLEQTAESPVPVFEG